MEFEVVGMRIQTADYCKGEGKEKVPNKLPE
jgi:hypothetical protein